MLIDYKIPFITVGNGKTTIKVVIYKGDITTQDEENENGELVPITRYRRTSKAKEETFTLDGEFIYKQIVEKLNQKLADYGTVVKIQPIDEQKVTTAVIE